MATRKPNIPSYITNPPIHYPEIKHDPIRVKQLFARVQSGDVDDVTRYVEDNKLNYRVKGDNNTTLLHSILDNETDMNTDKDKEKRLRMVQFLLMNGVNVNQPNMYGITPLHLAITKQDYDVFDLLMRSGANPNIKDNNACSALHYAVTGYKKKYEPIRKIGDIVPEYPESRKLSPVHMKILVTEMIKMMRLPKIDYDGKTAHINDQIKFVMSALKNYDKYFDEEYLNTVRQGFAKKMTELMGRTMGSTEFQMKKEFENVINNVRRDIEQKMNDMLSEFLNKSVDSQLSTYIDETKNLKRADVNEPIQFEDKMLETKILEQDRLIYDHIQTAHNKFTETNYIQNISEVIEKFRQYYDNVNDLVIKEITKVVKNVVDQSMQGAIDVLITTVKNTIQDIINANADDELIDAINDIPNIDPNNIPQIAAYIQNYMERKYNLTVLCGNLCTVVNSFDIVSMFIKNIIDYSINRASNEFKNYVNDIIVPVTYILQHHSDTKNIITLMSATAQKQFEDIAYNLLDIAYNKSNDASLTIDLNNIPIVITPDIDFITPQLNAYQTLIPSTLRNNMSRNVIVEAVINANWNQIKNVITAITENDVKNINTITNTLNDMLSIHKDIATSYNGINESIYRTTAIVQNRMNYYGVNNLRLYKLDVYLYNGVSQVKKKIGAMQFKVPALVINVNSRNESNIFDRKQHLSGLITASPQTADVYGIVPVGVPFIVIDPNEDKGYIQFISDDPSNIVELKDAKFYFKNIDQTESIVVVFNINNRQINFDINDCLLAYSDFSFINNPESNVLDNSLTHIEAAIRIPRQFYDYNKDFPGSREALYTKFTNIVSKIELLNHISDTYESKSFNNLPNNPLKPNDQDFKSMLDNIMSYRKNVSDFYYALGSLVPMYSKLDGLRLVYHKIKNGNIDKSYFRSRMMRFPYIDRNISSNELIINTKILVDFDKEFPPSKNIPDSEIFHVLSTGSRIRYYPVTDDLKITLGHTSNNIDIKTKIIIPALNDYGQVLKMNLSETFRQILESNNTNPDVKVAKEALKELYKYYGVSGNFTDDWSIQRLKQILIHRIVEEILINHFKFAIAFMSERLVRKQFLNFTNEDTKLSMFSDDNTKQSYITLYEDYVSKQLEPVFGMEVPVKVGLASISDYIVQNIYDTQPNLNELDSVEAYIKNAANLALLLDNPQDTNIFYNINYLAENPTYEKMCLILNPNILLTLLKRVSNINDKNIDGNSPLHLAIEIQHVPAIRMLLKKQAKLYGKVAKNYRGLSPYEYMMLLLSNHNKIMYESSTNSKITKFTNVFYKTFIRNIFDKPDFKNSIPEFMDTAFVMIIILFNYYLYKEFMTVKSNWVYSDMKQFVLILTKWGYYSNLFPYSGNSLLSLSDDEYVMLAKAYVPYGAMNFIQNKNSEEVSKLQTEIGILQQQHISLESEKKDLEESKSDTDILKIDAIVDKIFTINIDISNKVTKLNNLTHHNNNLDFYKNDIHDSDIKNIKQDIKIWMEDKKRFEYSVNDFIQEFDSINNLPNIDSRQYLMLWKLLSTSHYKLNSIEYPHLLLINFIHGLVNKANTLQELCKIKDDINVINKYYKTNIVYVVKMYNDSPPYYDKNIILKIITDIVIHVVKYVISYNLFKMIRKQVATTILELDNGSLNNDVTNMNNYLNETVYQILTSPYQNGETVQIYIMGDMTRNIVKKLLNVYDKDDDPAMNIVPLNVMEHICTILVHNHVRPITDSSNLIQNMKKFVIPYYYDLYTSCVPIFKQILDNYVAYLYNESRHVDVINTVVSLCQ
jgi:ankyrin repeat protein